MAAPSKPNGNSEPPREEIHLPGPSLLPVVTAAGITIALVGLIISWWIVAFGGIVTLVSIVRWVSTVRSEISELPSEQS